MSSLKMHEKNILEKLFNRGGYVLNFSNRTFSNFFQENGIDIYTEKYNFNGASKINRLRSFWELEDDQTTGKLLEALLEYACTIEIVSNENKKAVQTIINRLLNKSSDETTEKEFLNIDYSSINISKLNLDTSFESVIKQRLHEIKYTINNAPLAAIFLCGSTLEGILLDVAGKNPKLFNLANSAAKDKNTGIVLQFHDWSLAQLIDVAYEIGLISLDIKKYGHTLRDFRNYIHPRQQLAQRLNPDNYTAKISWQVLQAAIANLTGQR